MKKTYINPEMVVIPFVATQPIAYSVTGIGGDSDLLFGDGETPIDAATKSLNLDVNLWDDEW